MLIVLFSHRLMQIRIEGLPHRIIPLDAIPFQDAGEAPLNTSQTFPDLGQNIGLTFGDRRQRVDPPAKIFRGFDDIGGEFLHRVLTGIVGFPAAARPYVGRFRFLRNI